MHPILFAIGPITIYTYGFCIFLGVIMAYWVLRAKAVKAGIRKSGWRLFWAVVADLLGQDCFDVVEWRYFVSSSRDYQPRRFVLRRSFRYLWCGC